MINLAQKRLLTSHSVSQACFAISFSGGIGNRQAVKWLFTKNVFHGCQHFNQLLL